MQLSEFNNFGVIYYALLSEFSHDTSVPGTIMMEHSISNVTMRTIYRNIVHVGYIMLNADHFIGWIFLEEPAMALQVLCQIVTFARQTKIDLLCKQPRRFAFDADIRPIAATQDAII